MNDNNQDRSQTEGQEGIDRETEHRNRENETGQQSGKDQQSGQQGGQSPSDQDRGSSAFGQQGQSAGGDTNLSERTGQTGGQSSTGLGSSDQSGGQGGSGFVGSKPEDSSDYLTKGEQDQDFAPEGQGAKDTDAGRPDIETGQASDRDAELDDGSDSNR